MDPPGTITRLIRELEGAEGARRDDAARELWTRFFADLVAHARRRLRGARISKGPADEEDAAAIAFTKVCRGIAGGRLKLANRVDLTRILHAAATRETLSLIGRAHRRGGAPDGDLGLDQAPDPALAPELLLLTFDACRRLLELLPSDDLRHVALWKLAGHTNDAIAAKLERSPATVERGLSQIRETWRRSWGDALPLGPARSGPRPRSSLAPDDHPRQNPDDDAQILRDLIGLP